MLDILDPMAPPDLLSQEHNSIIDLPIKSRDSVREEKKLPLLKGEGESTYDNLKAESKDVILDWDLLFI